MVTRALFRVEDFGAGTVMAEPAEGAGRDRAYFTARRLCGAGDEVTEETFRPILDDPPLEDRDEERRKRLLKEAERLAQSDGALPKQLSGIAATLTALQADELPSYLAGQVPIIFDDVERASLWLVTVDRVLLARLAFLRAQLALRLTPDLRLSTEEFVGLRLFSDHSFTQGIDFGRVFDPVLLAFTPGALGYSFGLMPHALVLMFGDLVELREEKPGPMYSLYQPPVLNQPAYWDDPEFRDALDPSATEALIPWWADRLNVLYSHAADPTRWADRWGAHDPQAQAAWALTLERMLADAMFVAADVNGPALVRLQMAFDLLDKAEGLIGYDKARSGDGFQALLRSRTTLPRLTRAFTSMPADLADRFVRHAAKVYETTYEEIRALTLSHRLTLKGVKVARTDPSELESLSTDDYVAELVRAVRNSSHGFFNQMQGRERLILATHEGDLPTQLGELAVLIALALCADAQRVCEGDWWGDGPR